jgi:PAS domain S-box-containing protein
MRYHRIPIPPIILVGTLILTFLISYYTITTAQVKDQLRFNNEVQHIQQEIQTSLATYMELLRVSSSLMAVNPRVSRAEFRAFVQHLALPTHYPGIEGIGFAMRVPAQDLSSVRAETLLSDKLPSVVLSQQSPDSDHYPLLYWESLTPDYKTLMGIDHALESTQRLAMEQARDQAKPIGVNPSALVQAGERPLFSVYVPVYNSSTIPDTIAERNAALRGFVYGLFQVDELIANIFQAAGTAIIDFRVYDGADLQPEHLLYRSKQPSTSDAFRHPPLQTVQKLEVAGHPWNILFISQPDTELATDRRLIPFVILAGVLIGGLLYAIAQSLVLARNLAEKSVIHLHQSETRFRTLIEQSPLGVQILAADGRTIQVNQAWEQLWGLTLDQLHTYNIFRDEQLRSKGVMPYLYKALAGEAVLVPTLAYDLERTASETTPSSYRRCWVQSHIYPVKTETGEVREIVILYEDVTKRKVIEEALQKSHARLGVLYELSSKLLMYEQPQICIPYLMNQLSNHLQLEVYFNYLTDRDRQLLRLHTYKGISVNDAKSLEWLDLQPHEDSIITLNEPYIVENVQQSTDTRVALIRSLNILAYACYPLQIHNRTMGALAFGTRSRANFSSDELALMQMVCDQIATTLERSYLIRELQYQTEKLTQANRLKDEFLATLSHELRTPLNSMLGWATLLRTRHFNESTTDRALETIERNARLLSQLIEDLLDVSRIILGKIRLNITLVKLDSVVEAAIETVRLAAEAKDIHIETQFNFAGTILGDANRLQQVIWNLLSNAIKFTPRSGRVEVQLDAIDGQAQLQVRDTGQGIESEFLPFVFDRFRQVDGSSTRKYGGLGLGLAIVRHLVELHGGTAQAHSNGPDQGAVFTVRLPIQSLHESQHSQSARQQLSREQVQSLQENE